jgi:hypothetical protein
MLKVITRTRQKIGDSIEAMKKGTGIGGRYNANPKAQPLLLSSLLNASAANRSRKLVFTRIA